MKGLLLKEIYIWLRTRSFFMLLAFVYGILLSFQNGSSSGIFIYYALLFLPRAFNDDESSKWKEYSHALPYTPIQIISSKYFILLAETAVLLIITAVLSAINLNSYENPFDVYDAFPFITNGWQFSSNIAIIALCMLVGFAFVMPINYKFTGNLRIILSSIPAIIASIPIGMILLRLFLTDVIPYIGIPQTFYNNRWLFAAFAAIALLSLSASFMLCIIFTAKNKRKTKSLKIAFAIVAAAFVALSAFTIKIIVTKNLFAENKQQQQELLNIYYENIYEYESTDQKEYVLSKENIKNREEIVFLKENVFAEYHEGHLTEDCRKEFEELGLIEKEGTPDEYYLREGGSVVRLSAETDSNKTYQISISSKVGDNYIESATDSDLKEIENKFNSVSSEEELWNLYMELDFYPHYIEELYDSYYGKTRGYNVSFYISDYNETGEVAYCQLQTDVSEGKISDVRLYTYKQGY